jgi:decaprenyl-phosphate phosphoribosyltransferase
MLKDLIKLARPKHWVKQMFVFLPVPFALASGAELDVVRFCLGLGSFCLAASAIYCFNDTLDAERDRLHEEKRHRPVASGRVPPRVAQAWGLALAAGGLGLAVASGVMMAVNLFLLYLAVNLMYNLGAKHIALFDVFLLSCLYILRVLLGCALLDVEPSNWLLVVTYALALFLALVKRRADIIKGLDTTHRPALEGYNRAFLDQAIGISATMTIIAYAMYCMEAALGSSETSILMPGRELAGLPFVVFGVFDILRMAHVRGEGGNTVDLLLKSPGLLLTGVGWLGATFWSLRLP